MTFISSGLSSILDLIDLNDNAQSSLFNNTEWNTLNGRFMNMYLAKSVELSPFILDTWDIVVNVSYPIFGNCKICIYICQVSIHSFVPCIN